MWEGHLCPGDKRCFLIDILSSVIIKILNDRMLGREKR